MDRTTTQSGHGDSIVIAPLIRGTIIGRFTILEEQGRGGMGVVYAAYDPELDRKVAVKLLRPGSTVHPAEATARLVREGQTIAKVSHPNVVSVYEVGVFEDQVFLAMEFLDGPTLAQWQGRTWQEILDVYVAAGRGLAAAHAAGLVHRDFKPSNVILAQGTTTTPKVTDFGLAKAMAEGPEDWPSAEASPVGSDLTKTGDVMGTPKYMAPEQARGEASAQSDQFSFCKALDEALAPMRPPERIKRALGRGLSPDPAARHPSMTALLVALTRDTGARRRWGIVAAFAVFAAAGGAYVFLGTGDSPCRPSSDRLAGVWDARTREGVHAAFLASGTKLAEEAFAATAGRLDAWAAEVAAASTSACEATHVRREQSADLLDLRMGCVGDRIYEGRALTALLGRADAAVVREAPQAAFRLRSLVDCADTHALLAPERPPADARGPVAAIRARLAAAAAWGSVGRFAEARQIAESVATEAKALGFRPAVAEALILAGNNAAQAGDAAAGLRHLREAAWMAEASRHDRAAAQAWTHLVFAAAEAKNPERAEDAAERATAAIARLGRDTELEVTLLINRGKASYSRGAYAEARAFYEQALAMGQAALSPESPLMARGQTSLASALDAVGESARAEAAYRRAAAIYEKVLGPNHPSVGLTLANLATNLRLRGDLRGTVDMSRRAIAIYEVSLGDDHPYIGHASLNMGGALLAEGRFAEARAAFERALAIYEARRGADSPDVANALSSLGMTLQLEGKLDAAIPLLERAVTIHVAKQGPRHSATAIAKLAHADALLWRGDFRAAAATLEDAIPVLREAHGKDHPYTASGMTDLGRAYLGLRRAKDALPLLEEALRVQEAAKDPDWMAVTRFSLARALWETGGDRARARALARSAAEFPGTLIAPDLDAKTWLRRHGE